MQTALARFGFTVAAAILGMGAAAQAQTASTPPPVVAQATAAPAATPTPNPLTYRGYVRGFFFTRQNASNSIQGCATVSAVCGSTTTGFGAQSFTNQQSFNAALNLHGEYLLSPAGWSVGATYVYANPLNVNGFCDDPAEYVQGGTCQQYPRKNNNYLASDTTLPGYELASLTEAYLGFKDKYFNGKIGTQLYTSPWAGPSDSRVKPAYFEGLDLNANVTPEFTVGFSRMIQWQSRTSSDFNKSNLLPNSLNADGTIKNPTTGFYLGKVGFVEGPTLSANLDYYYFNDVADMLWIDGKWYPMPKSSYKPFLAAQFATENGTGSLTEGTISNTTTGIQVGASIGKIFDFAAGYNTMPWKSKDVAAASCAAAQVASGLFLPTGGSGVCEALGGGVFRIFYGGIASPYSDSYATDPLFTTSISQGMVDRRSAGDAFKIAGTFHTADNRVRLILSNAWYDYSNGAAENAHTSEFNADATYFFNKVGKGAYHGFSIRERYADRAINLPTGVIPTSYGGAPLFVYNRIQLEYDF